ncbi:MAG: hypothetical protein LUO79_07185, partial [Methanomassiliicoccales archaeon]|nr:hypothetical protein [Methanomassiliicoccales archaeon]
LGSSRLIFAVSEIRWLRTEKARMEEDERTGPIEDRRRPEDNPARERYEENLANYRRGMRVCKAELIVGLLLLFVTLLTALEVTTVDLAVVAGIVVAVAVIAALWYYVMTQEDAYL